MCGQCIPKFCAIKSLSSPFRVPCHPLFQMGTLTSLTLAPSRSLGEENPLGSISTVTVKSQRAERWLNCVHYHEAPRDAQIMRPLPGDLLTKR